jgi:hypothetical protein
VGYGDLGSGTLKEVRAQGVGEAYHQEKAMSYESRPKTDAERSGTHTHKCVDCERPFRCVGSDMCKENATCRCSQCYEDHVNREVAGTADTRIEVEREIVNWLRTTPTARKVTISIHSSQDIARLADAIELGEYRKPAKEEC